MLTQLKRILQVACALTVVAGVCLPLAAHATDLKIATIAPEGSSWMKDLRAAGLQIRERTAGRLNLKFYGGGIQGSDRKVLRKIRIGQLQGGVFTSNSLQERYPDIVIYGSPMLFDTIDEVDFVRKRLDKRLTDGLDKAGFVSFGFAGGGLKIGKASSSIDSGLIDGAVNGSVSFIGMVAALARRVQTGYLQRWSHWNSRRWRCRLLMCLRVCRPAC